MAHQLSVKKSGGGKNFLDQNMMGSTDAKKGFITLVSDVYALFIDLKWIKQLL